jgi:hypothetical protein
MKDTKDLSIPPIRASIGDLDKKLDSKIMKVNELINKTICNYEGLFCQLHKDVNNHGSNYGHLSRTMLPKLDNHLKILGVQHTAAIETPPHVSNLVTTSMSQEDNNHNNQHTRVATSWESNDHNNQHTRETGASQLPNTDTRTSNIDFSRNANGERPTNVNVRTCKAYAAFRQCHNPDSQSCGNSDHDNPPYPPHGPPHNPYLPSPCPPNLRQTSIPISLRCGTHNDGPAKVDIANVVGGPIISPWHGDRGIQARKLGTSHLDIMKLATKEYHVEILSRPKKSWKNKMFLQIHYSVIKKHYFGIIW